MAPAKTEQKPARALAVDRPALTNSPAAPPLLDPSHRTVLDKPIAPANKTFTGQIFYKDEGGKSYWMDAQGQRHYE